MTARPKISLVTPAYNSATYIEATIQSVIKQDYPNLEYVIVDGGSTDGTVEIIKRYAAHLADWISEPDEGMYDAIQKGFERTGGEIMAWLNADDIYFDWTLDAVARLFTQFEQVEWLTTNTGFGLNADGEALYASHLPGFSATACSAGEHLPVDGRHFALSYILQESTFWRRSLWERAGGRMDTSYRYAGDAELWFRFFQYARLYDVSLPLAGFRMHPDQITSRIRDRYHAEVDRIMQAYGGVPHGPLKARLRRLARKHAFGPLRPLLRRFGLLHRRHQITYRHQEKRWIIRTEDY